MVIADTANDALICSPGNFELFPLRLTLQNQKRQKFIILSINQMNLLRTGPVKDRGLCQSLLLVPIV